VLATVEALAPDVKRLLFIGVGCQVQALRAVERHLGLDKLYVLGTNCVDNGAREGLAKFLNAASATPATALHYEFMQVWGVVLLFAFYRFWSPGGSPRGSTQTGHNAGPQSGVFFPNPTPVIPPPPSSSLHAQDYKVHIKHDDGRYEKVFSCPSSPRGLKGSGRALGCWSDCSQFLDREVGRRG
jgi:hypothetical protein